MRNAVQDAIDWSKWLVEHEAKGTKDIEMAMRRIASRYGFSFSQLWAWRYRPPKDITASTYERIAKAYYEEKQRQLRLLQAELRAFEARTVFGRRLADAAADLGCEESQTLTRHAAPVAPSHSTPE